MTDPIVSVQRGSITIAGGATSGTAAITTVDLNNSTIKFGNFTCTDTGDSYGKEFGACYLSTDSEVTAKRGTSDATITVTVYFEVVEKDAAVMQSSVQRGSVALGSGATSNTASISSVSTSLAAVIYGGFTNTASGTEFIARCPAHAVLTSSTVLTLTRGINPTTTTTGYYEIEELISSLIQSIQTVSKTTTSANATDTSTITSVTTSQAELLWNGYLLASTSINNATDVAYRYELTATDTITYTRGGANVQSRTLASTIREYVASTLTSVQRGTSAMTSTTALSTTISAVTEAQSYTNFCGFTYPAAASLRGTQFQAMQLFDSTHIKTYVNTSSATTNTGSYEVVDVGTGGGGGTTTVSVPLGTLTLSQKTPTEKTTNPVPAGSLTLTSFAPTISNVKVVAPPAGTLSLTGLAPLLKTTNPIVLKTLALTALTSTGKTTNPVPAGALSLTAQTPTLKTTNPIPAQALTLGAFSPTASMVDRIVLATLSLTAQTPTVRVSIVSDVPLGTLSLTGSAPTLNLIAPISAGGLTLTAYAPTLPSAGVVQSVDVDLGNLFLAAFAPTIFQGTVYTEIQPSVSFAGGEISPDGSLYTEIQPALSPSFTEI